MGYVLLEFPVPKTPYGDILGTEVEFLGTEVELNIYAIYNGTAFSTR